MSEQINDTKKAEVVGELGKVLNKEGLSGTDKLKKIFSILYESNFFQDKLNLMIVGGTGVGKSSTIKALLKHGREALGDTSSSSNPEVGTTAKPETQKIGKYKISNKLTVWDTPGLGESEEADKKHTDKIIKKLRKKDAQGNALIDLVLVILDGKSRDFGTAINLINNVILPEIDMDKKRLLIAINKCDSVADEREEYVENGYALTPNQIKYLDEMVKGIQSRIKIDNADAIYYSAGLEKSGKPQERPYNIDKLLYYITMKVPSRKRLIVAKEASESKGGNDGGKNYRQEVEKSWFDSALDFVDEAADVVTKIHPVIGGVIKTAVGAGRKLKEAASKLWDTIKSWW